MQHRDELDLTMITVGPQVAGRGVRLDCTQCNGVGWTAYVAGEEVTPGRASLARLITIATAHVRERHTDSRDPQRCTVRTVRTTCERDAGHPGAHGPKRGAR